MFHKDERLLKSVKGKNINLSALEEWRNDKSESVFAAKSRKPCTEVTQELKSLACQSYLNV